ncbi:hypothetical protein [Desulfurispira natronophila]|uniref:Uncharacterized protein n=1 Tax=Desulfurispira natronophila TaxID=682562 RepID=A0A7W7Y6H3_9BACT|nr:hypothetical protein [Desulfurispira natronophila]MBB5022839.1 hypothetical protein [Desulfurispira natronophila]
MKEIVRNSLIHKKWAKAEKHLAHMLTCTHYSRQRRLQILLNPSSPRVPTTSKDIFLSPCIYGTLRVHTEAIPYAELAEIRRESAKEAIKQYVNALSALENADPYPVKFLWLKSKLTPRDSSSRIIQIIAAGLQLATILKQLSVKSKVIVNTHLSKTESAYIKKICHHNYAAYLYEPQDHTYSARQLLCLPSAVVSPAQSNTVQHDSNQAKNFLGQHDILEKARSANPLLLFIETKEQDKGKPHIKEYMKWRFRDIASVATEVNIHLLPFYHIFSSHNLNPHEARETACHASKSGALVIDLLTNSEIKTQNKTKALSMSQNIRHQYQKLLSQQNPVQQLVTSEAIRTCTPERILDLLNQTASYEYFFRTMPPSVILHAQAPSKDAKFMTYIARKHNHKVVYMSDRITGCLRPSSIPIGTPDFSVTHLQNPDYFFISDNTTGSTYQKYGVKKNSMFEVPKTLLFQDQKYSIKSSKELKLALFLQNFKDNMYDMLEFVFSAAQKLDCTLLLLPHPAYPVDTYLLSDILHARYPSLVSKVQYQQGASDLSHEADLYITGYSSAVIEPLLQGKPIVWLPNLVDNSIFISEFIQKIGFTATTPKELVDLATKIKERDPDIFKTTMHHRETAKALLLQEGNSKSLPEAIQYVISDSCPYTPAPEPIN